MLAEHKRKIEELERTVEAKNETIKNLVRLTDQQMQSTIESKMELIELKSKTGLELDIEAGMRLKEALLQEKWSFGGRWTCRSDTEEEGEDSGLQEVSRTVSSRQVVLAQQIDTLMDGIRQREKKLMQMRKQQMAMEAMSDNTRRSCAR